MGFEWAIYDGPGVGLKSRDALQALFKARFIKAPLDSLEDYQGLIIPGGADLPYIETLNANGMTKIKDFVKNGGAYLGVCAGAYFGSQEIDFYPDICGPRLGLLPVKAYGPKYHPYVPDSEVGARPSKHCFYFQNKEEIFYVNGGGWFETQDDSLVMARYCDDQTTSCVAGRYGKGVVILTMFHFELNI